MFSPRSRTVAPVRVLDGQNRVLSGYQHGHSQLRGNGSLLVFDFGQEIGGIVTVDYRAHGIGSMGLAFTEARNFTGFNSDESNGGSRPDGTLYENIESRGWTRDSYTMPLEKLRGGFRYLTLFSLTNSSIDIDIGKIELDLSFQPTWENLRAYGGYFDSNDELLNRIWYACAYTCQLNTIPPDTARIWGPPPSGWFNNATLGNGSSVIVDGAKRDRAVWAGDLGISIPSVLTSLGDLESVKNALSIQYTNQVCRAYILHWHFSY